MITKYLGWKPPTQDRVPINIHPTVRDRLNNLLYNNPNFHGVGFSEFIEAAIRDAETFGGYDEDGVVTVHGAKMVPGVDF